MLSATFLIDFFNLKEASKRGIGGQSTYCPIGLAIGCHLGPTIVLNGCRLIGLYAIATEKSPVSQFKVSPV